MASEQPWTTCLFTDILLTYLEEHPGDYEIDCAALFRSGDGLEAPSDPKTFLKDVNNWVPLPVLRELLAEAEKLSGQKDIAYHAARAYFDPDKRSLPSLFEVIVHVLNDIRSVFICANLWGAVQTNYLRLQSFIRSGATPELHMLARFGDKARPTIGALYLLRGICEGFPRLYRFIEDVQSIEEISQLRLADIAAEFPDYRMEALGDEVALYRGGAAAPEVRARKVALKSEAVPLSADFRDNIPSDILSPRNGELQVLTNVAETEPAGQWRRASAFRIVQAGALNRQRLSFPMEEGRVYDAPYSRFRFLWRENPSKRGEASADQVRQTASRLLFEHLRQSRDAQMRAVGHQIEKTRLALENTQLRREIEREYGIEGMIGEAAKMKELFGLVRSVAPTDMTVLIQGETGTGKELIARAIHYNSQRTPRRFIAVNCAALPETLLESELFGHEKGAFTGAINQRRGIFEVADGGTLFLDEIGETTPSTQVKLLRVLQEGEFQRVGGADSIKVDVRILAATNQNLEESVKQGRFRQDLYYRLHVFPIVVPPLRDRAEDIPLLASHFIEKSNKRLHKRIRAMTPEAMASLMAYRWPGNVRELENVIERMTVICKGDLFEAQDVPEEIRRKRPGPEPEPKGLKGIARESAEIVEKTTILEALSKNGGNVTRAARALGISRATLQNKMKLYGLRGPRQ